MWIIDVSEYKLDNIILYHVNIEKFSISFSILYTGFQLFPVSVFDYNTGDRGSKLSKMLNIPTVFKKKYCHLNYIFDFDFKLKYRYL